VSYTLVDAKGPVKQIASVIGMEDLLKFVERLGVWGPLKDFLDTGESYDIDGILKDISMYLPKATSPGVQSVLRHMQEGLLQSKGYVVITD
jgi:hypothetical protein